MTVTINLVYIVGLILYSLSVTAFWACAIVGAGKEAQDNIVEKEQAQRTITRYSEERDRYKGELERAICDKYNQEQTIKTLEADKQLLAREYLKATNEYAWYRSLVRAYNSETHLAAQAEMICRRKSVLAELGEGVENRLKPVERPAEASGTGQASGTGRIENG